MACAAALAVLTCHEQHDLGAEARRKGKGLLARLRRLSQQTGLISEVRGRGLMVGVELNAGDVDSTANLTDLVLEEMKDRGFLLGKTGIGRSVLTFMPPLIITEDQLASACEQLGEVLQAQACGGKELVSS